MNKQELFERISHLPSDCSGPLPMINKLAVLEFIKLLDEPQKPVVKQFVADWYEDNKDMLETNLFECIYGIYKKRGQNIFTTFEEWLVDEHTTPFQTIVNMHQFGYTVEKEKRYRVKAKGVCFNSCLIFEKINKTWLFSSIYETDHQRAYHTKKELEDAGFSWVFDCEGIEVEEVEE